mgnify:CR=1 FL=1
MSFGSLKRIRVKTGREIKIYKLVIMILCNLKTLLKAMPETNQKTLVKKLRA